MKKKSSSSSFGSSGSYDEIARTCACFHFRRATRSITALYDQTLAPVGLRSTQFVALLVIHLLKRPNMSVLAESLSSDRTTLTRVLAPLNRRGLIRTLSGDDKRSRFVAITAKGRKALNAGIPYWKAAQGKVLKRFGNQRWEAMLSELKKTDALERAS